MRHLKSSTKALPRKDGLFNLQNSSLVFTQSALINANSEELEHFWDIKSLICDIQYTLKPKRKINMNNEQIIRVWVIKGIDLIENNIICTDIQTYCSVNRAWDLPPVFWGVHHALCGEPEPLQGKFPLPWGRAPSVECEHGSNHGSETERRDPIELRKFLWIFNNWSSH